MRKSRKPKVLILLTETRRMSTRSGRAPRYVNNIKKQHLATINELSWFLIGVCRDFSLHDRGMHHIIY